MNKKTLVLCIMDGYGIKPNYPGNAITLAKKPFIDSFLGKYPNGQLEASQEFVGLPHGQMGNSEVGHLTIGSGRKIFQSLTLVSDAIETGEYFKNEELLKVINQVKEAKSNLHIMGLLSDGGVHSHILQIFAALKLANDNGIEKTYIHIFLDGRDTDQKSALKYLSQLENEIQTKNYNVEILTVSGRYYSMDRDKRWERLELIYDAMVDRKGASFTDIHQYIEENYEKGLLDEFVIPAYNKNIDVKIQDNDGLISCNFRPDRMIQLASAFTNDKYEFVPKTRVNNLHFVSMVKIADSVKAPFAFKNKKIINTLGEVVSKEGLKQLRIAETEKYAHVTFFFDGGENIEFPGEKRILIKSPNVATYDLKPEMSAFEISNTLVKELEKNYLDLVILNFANCDMVGHSGKLEPTINSVEATDEAIGIIYNKLEEIGGSMIITADHGNAECMLDNDLKKPITAHSTSPVPFILTSNEYQMIIPQGTLADVAPTILYILGIKVPEEMTGRILIEEAK